MPNNYNYKATISAAIVFFGGLFCAAVIDHTVGLDMTILSAGALIGIHIPSSTPQ